MLKINNLSVNYGAINALDNVSIDVPQGKIITLIGANGAGKSTLLNTISGLLSPENGSIEFLGEDIKDKKPQDIVNKGVIHVPEGRRIFEGMSVEENLKLGAFSRKDKSTLDEEIQSIYQRFTILDERKHQNAATLSGGEQQMLAISRALLSNPSLLLLDEPSMGLAPLIVQQIFEIIQETNQDGMTILLIEQNAHKALEIADYAYIIEGGQIKMEGTAKEVRESERVKEIYLGG
ncbi:MAG TPA: ABC transporter ATP-binding protein [Erysipelothrix sp.]|nr:ABC transporter ATP-binding protein [Erysipelothrix sp.]